ncbi:16S rRNA (uracil(1498)-N(3))-methyltransferase [Bifidobacterium xylocopae]|uniref:Ribosomal RNA small subunit methyltransferase E n=1 Tax=Bifidobacterium xylocopae TaxID=2493119 RepID=A0A366KB69_9BIFI|nr:16S rRNA (uracil(1498)-N(3))-methyltransferase [Bifidobacterium xylocopae]RBP98975.1 16S rRNA (uracil(1498)-N(3))-methyltransferase [Bifidobacterium xylocopae]
MTDPLFLFDPACDDTPVKADEFHTGWRLTLPQHVRRHAFASMRLGDGDRLQLTDGAGLRISARVLDPRAGLVEVIKVGREPKSDLTLTLVQALAKGGRDEQAVDMACQIGVDRVLPWQADRSIVKWKAGKMERKWGALLDAASEQSRRVWRPVLDPCLTTKGLVGYCERESGPGSMVILLHQDANRTWAQVRRGLERMAGAGTEGLRVSVIVGPEGGVSEHEADALTHAGALSTTLGRNILRASTAGPVALTAVSDALGLFDR